jgi:hypothetical protein
MLTPTIVKHWADTKVIHVIGYFGHKAGETYLDDENGLGDGSLVKWPPEIKSSRPPLMITSHATALPTDNVGINSNTRYELFILNGKDSYVYFENIATGAAVANNIDLSNTYYFFYAIFPKFF